MTPQYHDDTISTLSRLLAALATLALVGAVVGVGAVGAQSDQPTLRVTDPTTADGTTSVDVVLTAAPDGLAGYYLDLSVESPADARVVTASYPEQFGLTSDPAYDDEGGTVTLEAADLSGAVEAGATDIRLATVAVDGATDGDLSVTLDPRQFDADDGSAFEPARAAADASGAGATADGPGTAGTAGGGSGILSVGLVVVAASVVAVWLRRRGGEG